MRELQGDLIGLAERGLFDVIGHGCNCFHRMGAGIAKQLAQKYPSVQQADLQTVRGTVTKLGAIDSVPVGGFVVVNMYTQFRYGASIGQHVDYAALRLALRRLGAAYPLARIGLPRIGAGLAGGDWALIRPMIEHEMQFRDCTVVTLSA